MRDVDVYINTDCYYWNINICLLEIISKPRSKNVSGRYISKYFYSGNESLRLVLKK